MAAGSHSQSGMRSPGFLRPFRGLPKASATSTMILNDDGLSCQCVALHGCSGLVQITAGHQQHSVLPGPRTYSSGHQQPHPSLLTNAPDGATDAVDI